MNATILTVTLDACTVPDTPEVGEDWLDRLAALETVASHADQRMQARINALPTARARANARRAKTTRYP